MTPYPSPLPFHKAPTRGFSVQCRVQQPHFPFSLLGSSFHRKDRRRHHHAKSHTGAFLTAHGHCCHPPFSKSCNFSSFVDPSTSVFSPAGPLLCFRNGTARQGSSGRKSAGRDEVHTSTSTVQKRGSEIGNVFLPPDRLDRSSSSCLRGNADTDLELVVILSARVGELGVNSTWERRGRACISTELMPRGLSIWTLGISCCHQVAVRDTPRILR
ncbi:hypothetical protein BKA65DRAFT_201192 [Rhexocercosporidium sp. MPI-PUGE-AT-0058]|nr:hypothetical protein BKA65DRAFT_201192 [Rhexocercosporidium sp. MPI-PUGE-AT-0058]